MLKCWIVLKQVRVPNDDRLETEIHSGSHWEVVELFEQFEQFEQLRISIWRDGNLVSNGVKIKISFL